MSQYRIAVATADGKKVDQHFGSASGITIYIVDDGRYEVEKTLSFDGGGICSGDHGDVYEKLEAVADCRYIIAAKIGGKVQRYFESRRQKYFEMPDSDTDYVVGKIARYKAGAIIRKG